MPSPLRIPQTATTANVAKCTRCRCLRIGLYAYHSNSMLYAGSLQTRVLCASECTKHVLKAAICTNNINGQGSTVIPAVLYISICSLRMHATPSRPHPTHNRVRVIFRAKEKSLQTHVTARGEKQGDQDRRKEKRALDCRSFMCVPFSERERR